MNCVVSPSYYSQIENQISLLIVDDDPLILSALKRVFNKSRYEVFLCETGEQALTVLHNHKIDVLLSDMKMEPMNGLRLLEKVRYYYPTVYSIVLSGQSSYENIIGLINNTRIYAFVEKPWNNEHLLETVNLAAQKRYTEILLKNLDRQKTDELESDNRSLKHTVLERTVELEQSLLIIEQESEVKSKFVSTISHELMTPMHAIRSFAHLLDKSEMTEKQKKYLNNLQHSADRLYALIQDLLILSQGIDGFANDESVNFNLENLFKPFVHDYSEKARSRNLQFVSKISADIPQSLNGRLVPLLTVLNKLMDNAFKFTEFGEIALSIELKQLDVHEALLFFRLADTGIGMTVQDFRRYSEIFTQADMSHKRQYGGAGIGLAVCRHILNSVGGKIWAEETEGPGTVVGFDFPFKLADRDLV